MESLSRGIVLLVALSAIRIQSFDIDPNGNQWTVRGKLESTNGGVQASGGNVELIRAEPITSGNVVEIRLRLPKRSRFAVVLNSGSVSLLNLEITRDVSNEIFFFAKANGIPMETSAASVRDWTTRNAPNGRGSLGWRYQTVGNLWDEVDRRQIGHANSKLPNFDEKITAIRVVYTNGSRQIWIDERLVAEDRSAPKVDSAQLALSLSTGASLVACDVSPASNDSRYVPLNLTNYWQPAPEVPKPEKVPISGVPMLLNQHLKPDFDLGDALYRYRLVHGSGLDTPYVDSIHSWPSPLKIDPASFTFRIPKRDYQNVYLAVWNDERPNSVTKGTLRFYREGADSEAATDFEISEAAVASGFVNKIEGQNINGKQLYLVRVPVNTEAMYGLSDLPFYDLEISKPVALMRSYPDPIYYGRHPAGLPSSLHVTAITLEQSPFGYKFEPKRNSHIFEQPELPAYDMNLTNNTDNALKVKFSISTRSYKNEEITSKQFEAEIPAQGRCNVPVELDLKRLGWHDLNVKVASGNAVSAAKLSLVLLPANKRTYGDAPNEVRFGAWELLGHYLPVTTDRARNESHLAMLRRIGVRRISYHDSFFDQAMLKKYDFLPTGPHTNGYLLGTWNPNNAEMAQKFLQGEDQLVAAVKGAGKGAKYYYGAEWAYDHIFQNGQNPRYAGGGPYQFSEAANKTLQKHIQMLTMAGRHFRETAPEMKLILQWGAPQGTIAYLEKGFPRELIDGYGMDAPMFELMPEVPTAVGCINNLWAVRQEINRLGYPNLGIHWTEGPFFPTNPGALTYQEQEENLIRYWLLGLAYGVESFDCAVIPHDAGNYYGCEHYGAGLIHRTPLENPKPSLAAAATATSMLCGADFSRRIDTGSLTTYCFEFKHVVSGKRIYALWRVRGECDADLAITGGIEATLTDSMGNPQALKPSSSCVHLTIGTSPIWLSGIESINSLALKEPRYVETPAQTTRELGRFDEQHWCVDKEEQKSYSQNHFAICRVAETEIHIGFENDKPHGASASVTLPVQNSDRPLAIRYASLRAKQPIEIPGKASSVGMWIKGNSSWGRVAYQLKDANGEIWTSIGTKDDWNCDDAHCWSFVNFDGWRFVRFPLPGNQPYDCARNLENTWWKHEGGDGIVDLPLRLEQIFLEAHNEVPWLGQMKQVPDRTYKLAGLIAEYSSDVDLTEEAVALTKIRMPIPEWKGPEENVIAGLRERGTEGAPQIKSFEEPHHENDGRRIIIHFEEQPNTNYRVYLSRYNDGRGAQLLASNVHDSQMLNGLRPGVDLYFFLTATGRDNKESKPSQPCKLITQDKFLEK